MLKKNHPIMGSTALLAPSRKPTSIRSVFTKSTASSTLAPTSPCRPQLNRECVNSDVLE
ncbi:hypothetical protein RP20_CCG011290 [Aedes albopictus]|nr:hypothetical protein RP20_CCG011290 [Aedes albopictus]